MSKKKSIIKKGLGLCEIELYNVPFESYFESLQSITFQSVRHPDLPNAHLVNSKAPQNRLSLFSTSITGLNMPACQQTPANARKVGGSE